MNSGWRPPSRETAHRVLDYYSLSRRVWRGNGKREVTSFYQRKARWSCSDWTDKYGCLRRHGAGASARLRLACPQNWQPLPGDSAPRLPWGPADLCFPLVCMLWGLACTENDLRLSIVGIQGLKANDSSKDTISLEILSFFCITDFLFIWEMAPLPMALRGMIMSSVDGDTIQ